MGASIKYEGDLSGKAVDVYQNLQKNCYSIRSRETDTYGIVISHEESVIIRDASFVVNENQRQKVIEQERKNVHAFVRGHISGAGEWDEENHSDSVPVTYNPYECANFVHKETGEPIESAELVLLNEDGCFAFNINTN